MFNGEKFSNFMEMVVEKREGNCCVGSKTHLVERSLLVHPVWMRESMQTSLVNRRITVRRGRLGSRDLAKNEERNENRHKYVNICRDSRACWFMREHARACQRSWKQIRKTIVKQKTNTVPRPDNSELLKKESTLYGSHWCEQPHASHVGHGKQREGARERHQDSCRQDGGQCVNVEEG